MSLENVAPDKMFWLEDGRSIKNLFELLKELKRSDDAIFYKHVNNKKNDFYNWIRHAVKDYALAKKLRYVKDKATAVNIINDRIKYYKLPFQKTSKATKPKALPVEKIETKFLFEPESKSLIKVKAKPLVKIKPKPVVKVKPKPLVKIKPKPVVKIKPKPLVKIKPKPVVKIKPKSVVKIKPKPVVKVKAKKIVKIKPKPIIKLKSKQFKKTKPKKVAKAVITVKSIKKKFKTMKPKIIHKHIIKEVPAHSPTEILAHMALGIVIGAALMVIILMVV